MVATCTEALCQRREGARVSDQATVNVRNRESDPALYNNFPWSDFLGNLIAMVLLGRP